MLTPKDKAEGIRNMKSRQRAIELMCKQCVYMPGLRESWREQVQEQCPQPDCPLFNWRPCVGGEARRQGQATRIDPKPRLQLEE